MTSLASQVSPEFPLVLTSPFGLDEGTQANRSIRNFDPTTIGIRNLQRSVEWSRWRMERYRTEHLNAISQYVGSHYSEGGAPDRVPINFLELAINIYRRQIAPTSPSVQISTHINQLKPTAKNLELATRKVLKEIGYDLNQNRWILDSLFAPMGIMKVGLTPPALANVQSYKHDAGQPFADPIDLDDWVHDMTAKRLDQVQYSGHRYRLPFEFVMDSGLYDVGNEQLFSFSRDNRSYNEMGDPRVETIGQGFQHGWEELDATVELWDIWIPSRQEVMTFSADSRGVIVQGGPIRTVFWRGIESGPYHYLAYNDVPNNSMPLPPVALMQDLHMLANLLFNKLGRQGARQKTVLGVRGGADRDGNRVINAQDGQAFTLDDPNSAREYNFGGIAQENLAFLLQVRDFFYDLQGNLDALGGLSPQSSTLGQDQILNRNASQRLRDMQDRATSASKGVMEAIVNYIWNDPITQIDFPKPAGESGIVVPGRFSRSISEGDLTQYAIDVQPFGQQHKSPADKLQSIMTVLERIILPMAPLMQQQGLSVDVRSLISKIADLGDLPEIQDIIIQAPQQPEEGGPSGDRPLQSPNTSRTNVRVNRPGATRRASDSALSSVLLGGNVQQSQRAAIGRPNS